jgi:hypothetical protein
MSLMSTGERAGLVNLLGRVRSVDLIEAEQDDALRDLRARVPRPRVSGVIFWPMSEGFDG